MKSRSLDITKHDTTLTQGLLQTGDPLPKPKAVEPPTSTNNPSTNQKSFTPTTPPKPSAEPRAGGEGSGGVSYAELKALSAKYGMGRK
jgi:hypothetical protein